MMLTAQHRRTFTRHIVMNARPLRFLELFAGIGGMGLGLERAGMQCVGQVEIDPYCRAVLAKHWPDVKRMDDVRSVRGDEFGPVDLVCGGVPCQPASCAGKRKGSSDERWLWGEFVRIVRDSGCSWFLAENVRGFLSLPDAPGVVRDLEGAGFEVRTVLLGAHHVGAPHKRDRVWIVGRLANARVSPVREAPSGRANGTRRVTAAGSGQGSSCGDLAHPALGGLGADGIASGRPGHADERGAVVAHPEQPRRGAWSGVEGDEGRAGIGGREPARGMQLADAQEPRREGHEPAWDAQAGGRAAQHGQRWPSRPGEPQHEWEAPRLVYAQCQPGRSGDHKPKRPPYRGTSTLGTGKSRILSDEWHKRAADIMGATVWLSEPYVGGSTDGLPRRLVGLARRSALRALGNSVVPSCAEVIGRAIMEAAR